MTKEEKEMKSVSGVRTIKPKCIFPKEPLSRINLLCGILAKRLPLLKDVVAQEPSSCAILFKLSSSNQGRVKVGSIHPRADLVNSIVYHGKGFWLASFK